MTFIPLWGIFISMNRKKNISKLDATIVSINQLKRISGQINGIINMIETDRSCVEIVDQVLAAKNSISRVGKDLLMCQIKNCSKKDDLDEFEQLLKKLLNY